jgi:hypothetical protein
MKKQNRKRKKILIYKANSNFKKKIRRIRRLKRLEKGYLKYLIEVDKFHPKAKRKKPPLYFQLRRSKLSKKPEYDESIRYILKNESSFSRSKHFNSNVLMIPSIFSFSDNYDETSNFIKLFFLSLHNQINDKIILDYSKCKRIDVGASMVMDVLLTGFIQYFNKWTKSRRRCAIQEIIPINYQKKDIRKILFSIGAFRNIRGFKDNDSSIIEFPLYSIDKRDLYCDNNIEIHITNMVEYIIQSLKRMNRNLTIETETNLYKVIGEVISNATEHSDTNKQYSVGYFEDNNSSDEHFGIFNLAIMNFGNTIYETFKSPDCKNKEVVKQMEELSNNYTKKRWIVPAEFEEETLWTLYALQEGITRKEDWKRGNGSIRFIESFFKIKGNDEFDKTSTMSIISGNTKINFNGEYQIVERERGKNGELFKMMTFNKSGDIEEQPDKRYVTFVENYFPGTLITIKLKIGFNNTEKL